MPGQPDRDALVIRFKPIRADAMLASAQKEFRRSGSYRLSVFADSRHEGDPSDEAVIARMLEAAKLSHIDPNRNPKFFLCADARALMDDGFEFVKDNYAGEEPEHYSIDLGNDPSLQDTERLAGHFSEARSWS
jgi:hypothetical protein